MRPKPKLAALLIISALVLAALAACTTILPLDSAEVESEAPAQSTAAEGEVPAGPETGAELLPPTNPPFSTTSWSTDFLKRSVAWEEILSGGPPKDGIPAVDDPAFERIEAAGEWLTEREPVILFAENGDVRAYPLSILIWHEIVNDTVGDRPVAVTFCPLCNASIVFDRTLDGNVLDFGTTGKLRNSDLIMYDRQTESWWQQFTGQGIVGAHTGRQLEFLPSQVLSFKDVAAEFPDAQVLARPPASRRYGANPYVGYDTSGGRPFLYNGELDERLAATERVVGLALDGSVTAYPFSVVAAAGAVNDVRSDVPLVVFHKSGVASALDAQIIGEGRDIGSVVVYDRRVGDQTLTFSANGDGTFSDAETGSTWNILGEAIEGDLAGAALEQLIAFDHFWFAWTAFFPETDLYEE